MQKVSRIRRLIRSIQRGIASINLYPEPFTYEDVQKEVDEVEEEVDNIIKNEQNNLLITESKK